MTDATIATVARRLAVALMRFGHSRDPADKQEVLRLETELCASVRTEEPETQQEPVP